MRKALVVFGILLLIGGTLGMAYALSGPPSKETLATEVGTINSYSFTREITFKQFHVRGVYNGTAGHIEKKFAYTGKVITTGRVEMATGIVKEHEEFYINGTLVMSGNITANLRTGKVSGEVVLANGTSMSVTEVWRKYYGINQTTALEMMRENLPLLALRETILDSNGIKVISDSASLPDRILMGLGFKEKLFEYEFTTKSGRTWHVFVDSKGIPRKFESTTADSKIVVYITPTG